MSGSSRVISTGGLAGLVGAAIGAAAILGMRTDLGCLLALLAGGTAGVLGSRLAAGRLLRDATACLAWVADGDRAGAGGVEPDAGRSRPSLGSEDFDAWVAHLREIVDRSSAFQAEHAGVLRLARRLQAAMAGVHDESEPGDGTPAGSLETFLERLRQTAVPVDRDLGGLEEANERVASGARDQSEAVSRTATSVEALSDRIDRIAQHSGEAADACDRARQEAHQGLEQVIGVIEGMDQLLTRIESNGRKVRRLEERSTEIGTIVEWIRGISGRTDMLALNATIESIRAGEHGRGFAVIAKEIRKLADRTAGATREIGALVEAIQSDAQESLQALGEEQSQMQAESQRLRETGRSLERISQIAERSARLVDGISRSTRDQVQATQDLVRAMQRISDVARQAQERTAQARSFIRALKGSCEPWRRLAAAPPNPSSSEGPAQIESRPSEASQGPSLRQDGPALVVDPPLAGRGPIAARSGTVERRNPLSRASRPDAERSR